MVKIAHAISYWEPQGKVVHAVTALLQKRQEMRDKGDWGKADKIRDKLLQLGITVRDERTRTTAYYNSPKVKGLNLNDLNITED